MIYLLNEAIEDIKKYYPNIPDDIFLQLIELDPTYRQGSSSAGKYGKWLLNLYNKGNLSDDDFNEVTPLLNQFTTYRNRIQNKDLNAYKSLDALASTLADVIDDDSMLTDRQKVRFLKNVKSGRIKTSAEDDYDVVLETPKFIVYVPNTHEASMKLGKGTKWCTAHENPEWYNHYTENNGKLYIIKNKFTNERWQYSDSTGDFLDEDDDSFYVLELLQEDDRLLKFFRKLTTGVDDSEPFIYSGQDSNRFGKELATNIIVANSVTKLKSFAFKGCATLQEITIPNSVTDIGMDAFAGCTSLQSLIIPNSVTKIGIAICTHCISLQSVIISNNISRITSYSFCNCKNLTHVVIPEGIRSIGNCTFEGCESLTSINIPNSVIDIHKNAFEGCNNLTIYTNNEYVIQYCEENNIPVKPLSSNESYKKSYKLHIREY